MNKTELYYIVAKILSLKFNNDNKDKVASILPGKKEDLQMLVKTASDHYVLQTLFIILKENNLLNHLPDELTHYLEHVHELNYERNTKITEQALQVNSLLINSGIDCVFMKGTGNLFDGLYKDYGERLIYDIDILVENDKMITAANLLKDSGYKTQKEFIPKSLMSTMHYPILVNENCVAGLEIHRMPVSYRYEKNFSTEKVFSSRKKADNEKDIYVMSDKDKVIHNFIHSQLMHNGNYHGNVSLRDLFDLMLFNQNNNVIRVFDEYNHYKGKAFAYSKLAFKVFQLSVPGELKKRPVLSLLGFKHRITLSLSGKKLALYLLLAKSVKKYIILPLSIIWSKHSRNYVFTRISRRKWYKEHIKSYKRKYSKKKSGAS